MPNLVNYAKLNRAFLGMYMLPAYTEYNLFVKMSSIDYGYLDTNSERVVRIADNICKAIRGNGVTYGYRSELQRLFLIVVKSIDKSGMVTKYKTVNSIANNWRLNMEIPDFYEYSGLFPTDKEQLEDIKLGRFLSTYTNMTELEISMTVDSYNAESNPELFAATVEYKSGSARSNMREAYSFNKPVPQNWNQSSGSYKQIHGSCMQGGFDNEQWTNSRKHYKASWEQLHPAEAYAVEELVIHYLINKKTQLPMARVIVSESGRAAMPIYAESVLAGNCLDQFVKDAIGKSPSNIHGDFDGITFRQLHTNQGYIATPYLDNGHYIMSGDDDLQFGYSGNNGSTAGFSRKSDIDGDAYNEDSIMCECCDNNYDESDITYVESDEYNVCDSCLYRHYTRSDISGEYYCNTNMTTAINSRGRTVDIANSELEDGDYIYCDHECEYIHSDLMVNTVCETLIYINNDNCVELDGLYYMADSEELKAAKAIAELLYCQRPMVHCDRTPDLFNNV